MTLQSPSRFKRTVRNKMKEILSLSDQQSPGLMDKVKRALISIQRDAKRRAAAPPSRASVVLTRRDLNVVDFGVGDFYAVSLTTKPSAEVVVAVYDPMRQVSCFPSVLSFTAVNFDHPQVVRVMCSDATAYDENFSFLEHKVTSTDLRYHKADVATMVVRIFSAPSSFAWGFGDGHEGQLGMEGPFPTTNPNQIHISYSHSAAATAAEVRTGAGSPRRGNGDGDKPAVRGGDGTLDLASQRSRIDICSVACGETHSAFVTSEGQLFTFGQLVASDPPPGGYRGTQEGMRHRATRYPTLWHGQDIARDLHSVIVSVSCGQSHAAALTDNGVLLTWGSNTNGRLGLGRECSGTNTPMVVPNLKQFRIIQVSCGARHTAAVENAGGLFTWGMSSTGALGLGDVLTNPRDEVWVPRKVESIKETVFMVGCGAAHTVAVCHSGKAYTCGWKDNGRLGRRPQSLDEEATFAPIALRCDPKSSRCPLFVSVAVGGAHTLLLSHTRAVYAFGSNSFGQLGVGDTNDRGVPTEVRMHTSEAGFQTPRLGSGVGSVLCWRCFLLLDACWYWSLSGALH